MEFEDAMARAAALLCEHGHEALAATVLRLSAHMRDAGYQGGTGAESTRQRVREGLDDLAREALADAVRAELLYAAGWIAKAEEADRRVSAKRHLDRRPSRDIGQR